VKFNVHDPDFREAIWEAHNKKCAYSQENLRFIDMDIEHIVPKSLKYHSEALSKYLEEIGENEDFDLDSINNLLPVNSKVNQRKNNSLLPKKRAIHYLTLAESKAKKVMENYHRKRKRRKFDKVIRDVWFYVNQGIESPEKIYDKISNDHQVFETTRSCYEDAYFNSKDFVSLRADLPTSPEEKGWCEVSFRSLKIRDTTLRFDHFDILDTLFTGLNTNPSLGLRRFAYPCKNGEYLITFKQVSFSLTEVETEQLCSILDDFASIYLKALVKIEDVLQVKYFNKSNRSRLEYRLIKVKRAFWKELVEFAYEHNYHNGSTEWHIFSDSRNVIIVFTPEKDHRFNSGHHVFLRAESDSVWFEDYFTPNDEVWITWGPPSEDYGNYLDTMNNRERWDALFTYNWLIYELIPKVIEKRKLSRINEFQIKYHGFYESGFTKVRENSFIELNQRELSNFMDELLTYYAGSKTNYYLSKDEIVGLYSAIELCLSRTPYSFELMSCLFIEAEFKRGNSGLMDNIRRYKETLKDGVYSYWKIENAMRCLDSPLSLEKSDLSVAEIKEIVNLLDPFFERMKRGKLIQRLKDGF
jgi:hypothetical protein